MNRKKSKTKCSVRLWGLALPIAALTALKGGKKRQQMRTFSGVSYAHRGYHTLPDVPENTIPAFQRASKRGFGIEMDLHLTKDGKVVVFHDSDLKRLCGIRKTLEECSLKELKHFRIQKTKETIPTLEEVLTCAEFDKPFLLEIKTYQNNGKELTDAVMNIMKKFPEILFCIESFDPRVLVYLKENFPDVIRGQLSSGYFVEKKGCDNPLIAFAMANLYTNFWAKPDFISYDIKYRHKWNAHLVKQIYKTPIFWWTVSNREEMKYAFNKGDTIIFESIDPV